MRKPKRKTKSRALAVATPTLVQHENPQTAFIAMIERVATDPKADVAKVKELLQVRNDDFLRVAKMEFNRAMVEVQTALLPIRKNIKADRFAYASFEALDDVMRPKYSSAGFGLTFDAQAIEGSSRILVTCDVLHRGGYDRRYSVPITPSAKGPKGGDVMTQTQAEGAAISFARRYLLLMIFNIVTTEDDVAQQPETANRITDAQLYELVTLLKGKDGQPRIEEKSFCAYIGTDKLINLPASKFTDARDAIIEKRKAMA